MITNSLAIANELADFPNLQVVMPGGRLRRETASLVGADGLDYIATWNAGMLRPEDLMAAVQAKMIKSPAAFADLPAAG